jgi:hypothetical protein
VGWRLVCRLIFRLACRSVRWGWLARYVCMYVCNDCHMSWNISSIACCRVQISYATGDSSR